MSDQYSCEFCSNYVYDEEYEEYGCVVNMDEDDLAMLMQFKRATCPKTVAESYGKLSVFFLW